MAAVTINRRRDNIKGSYKEIFYNLDIANSGDTLSVKGMRSIEHVSTNDVAVTKAGISGQTITFTTTGAVVGVRVAVSGN